MKPFTDFSGGKKTIRSPLGVKDQTEGVNQIVVLKNKLVFSLFGFVGASARRGHFLLFSKKALASKTT